MKLRAIHLFIILIGSLILCGLICSCFPTREGMKGDNGKNPNKDVALEVQEAGKKQAASDYNDYQAELAREGLPTDDPNKNYPSSNSNIGGDPATWGPPTESYGPSVPNSYPNPSSGGVMSDIENTFTDAGKDIENLFSDNTNTKQPTSTGTTKKNGYTTTATNKPDYSYVAPAGDTVDVYKHGQKVPWYDNKSSKNIGGDPATWGPPTQPSSGNIGGDPATWTPQTMPQPPPSQPVQPIMPQPQYIPPSGGIPSHQIPSGDEDLYILKSQIVPPVCPACPAQTTCPRQEPCQPCPPCARCPEPAFECKKVPNYSSSDNQYLPRPVLNDFSSFGM